MKAQADESFVLAALEGLASKLGLRLIYADFDESEPPARGGRCRVKGKELILLDRSTGPKERIELLAEALRGFSLQGFYLPPAVRILLEAKEGSHERDPV